MSVRRTARVEDVLWALGRVTLYSGVVAWVVSTVTIFAAIWTVPWFSWPGNALSDLGHPTEPSAPIFNNGLILAGILGTLFVVRVAPRSENLAHWIGVVITFFATLDLSLIGVFPIVHPLHGVVSIAFFVSLTFGLFFYGTGEILADRRRVGLWLIWLAIAHVTGWLLWSTDLGTDGVAIPEFVGSLVLLGWVIPVTRRLRRETIALIKL